MHSTATQSRRHLARFFATGSIVLMALTRAPLAPGVVHAAGTHAPCMPPGYGSKGAVPVLAFGRGAGFVAGRTGPMGVQFYSDGTLVLRGSAVGSHTYKITTAAVQGLQRLAAAEGFGNWPVEIKAPRRVTDIPSRYVSVREGCSAVAKTVTLDPGAQNPAFTELWNTLLAASGFGTSA